MVYINKDIDIDIDDFLWACDNDDIEEVIDWLKSRKHIDDKDIDEDKNIMDLEWDKVIDKLSTKRIYLTQQEEDTIKSIANRL